MRFRQLLGLFFIGCFLHFNSVFGQRYSVMADSLDVQFDQINKTSRNYQDSKIVKRYKLADLRTNTLRNIDELGRRIDSFKEKNEKQEEAIKNFEAQLEKVNTELKTTQENKDQLSFLGIGIYKATYQTIVLILIVGFLVLLLFYIYKFKKSHELTAEAQKNLINKEKELKEFRQKALEEQQKLGRQLMDERQKNENEKDDLEDGAE